MFTYKLRERISQTISFFVIIIIKFDPGVYRSSWLRTAMNPSLCACEFAKPPLKNSNGVPTNNVERNFFNFTVTVINKRKCDYGF